MESGTAYQRQNIAKSNTTLSFYCLLFLKWNVSKIPRAYSIVTILKFSRKKRQMSRQLPPVEILILLQTADQKIRIQHAIKHPENKKINKLKNRHIV
jgi:hypothetical protein